LDDAKVETHYYNKALEHLHWGTPNNPFEWFGVFGVHHAFHQLIDFLFFHSASLKSACGTASHMVVLYLAYADDKCSTTWFSIVAVKAQLEPINQNAVNMNVLCSCDLQVHWYLKYCIGIRNIAHSQWGPRIKVCTSSP